MVLKPNLVEAHSPSSFYPGPFGKLAVVWHITEGSNSLDWLRTGGEVSANYLIARDGTIYEIVRWQDGAWVNGILEAPDTGNPVIARIAGSGINPNKRTTGIECEGFSTRGAPGALTRAQSESLVRLTAWLCQVQGHPCDRTHVIRHAQVMRYAKANCPGFAEAEMQGWIDQAARLLANGTGGGATVEDQNRERLLSTVERVVPLPYRGALTREGRLDATAFGGSTSERVAIYEKLRCHTLNGSVMAFALDGPSSYDALVAAGRVQLY